MSLPPLYPHQIRSIAGVRDEYRKGARAIVLVLPCGAGKTRTATEICGGALRKGKRLTFLVHREELLTQAVSSLEQLEVQPGVIRAGKPSTDPLAPIQVASVQTLHSQPDLLPPTNLVVSDECFPAGTLIDGRPIETVLPMDVVRTDDGSFHHVAAVMKRAVRELVRVVAGARSVVCTPEHPFLTRDGWVPARELTSREVRTCDAEDDRNDVRNLPDASDAPGSGRSLRVGAGASRTSSVLLAHLPDGGASTRRIGDHGADEPAARLEENDGAQPDAASRGSRAGFASPHGDGPPPAEAGRERAWAHGAAEHAGDRARAADRGDRADAPAQGQRLPLALQAGHRGPRSEGRDRGGRVEPLRDRAQGAGPEEGCVLGWARVDRVEVLEPGRDGTFGGVCPDGHVYNLEVETRHTYVAAGFVVHNCHHDKASSRQALLGKWPTLDLILGLTATPERGDGKPLGLKSGGVYQAMVVGATVRELQQTLRPDGHPILVPFRVYGPTCPTKELFREPLEGYLEFGRRVNGSLRPALIFAASLDESRELAARAKARGVRAAHVDGETPELERREIFAAMREGRLDLISNVLVATEGTDLPNVEVVGVARGCSAASTWIQMVMRAGRSCPATGKRDAVLIDYRGFTHVHGLMEEERAFSLEGKAIERREKLSLRQCGVCGCVFEPEPKCPSCGAELPRMQRQRAQVAQHKAIEITARSTASIAEKWEFFKQLKATQVAKGYKPAWIGIQFQRRYSHWPSWGLGGGRAA